MANLVKDLGKGIMYLGMGTMFIMAIVGSIAIDIVLIAALTKALKSNSSSNNNSFLTGYLWGTLFSNRNSSTGGFYSNLGVMLVASPFLTLAAIGLSVALGVSEVGIALAVGWGIAIGLVALGALIHGIGETLDVFASSIGDLFSSRAPSSYSRGYAQAPAHVQSNTVIMRDTALAMPLPRTYVVSRPESPVTMPQHPHVVARAESHVAMPQRSPVVATSEEPPVTESAIRSKGFFTSPRASAPLEEEVNNKKLNFDKSLSLGMNR